MDAVRCAKLHELDGGRRLIAGQPPWACSARYVNGCRDVGDVAAETLMNMIGLRDAGVSHTGTALARRDAPPGADLSPCGDALLRPLLQTTREVPPAEQFDFWRSTTGSIFEHEPMPAEGACGFLGDASTWRFGSFALTQLEMSRGRYRRTARQVRRDGVDHWVLTVALHGQRVIRSGDTEVVMRPGALFVGSLDQSFETVRTDSAWLHLYVSRDAMPGLGPALDAARHRPLAGAFGRLLHDYIRSLATQLPDAREEDAPRLAEATRAMIAAALAPAAKQGEAVAQGAQEAQRERVRRIIRANLGSASLGPERLCTLAGISRSQLYRLFEPSGGIASHIQSERLRAAHRALSNPADPRSIGRIAEDVGLFDPSSFSRMFRRAYGCSPSEMRMTGLSGWSPPMPVHPPRGTAPQTIADLLRHI